jgi:hypothetical protein
MRLKLGKWNVNIINTGDNYGLNMCLLNVKAPMVEFYDGRYPHVHAPYGQFICRYYISTILSGNLHLTGLCLDDRIPAWQVSAEDMAQVVTFLKEHNGNA